MGLLESGPKKNYEFYEKMSADRLNSFHVKLLGTKVVLIDEISLVGTNFFKFIDLRLQEIKGNRNPFGGLHVICFGDLYQLPPVRDKWLFENNKYGLHSLSINLWTELFEIYELTEIMRQRDEYSFAQLLKRMREGLSTPDDIRTLQNQELSTDVQEDEFDCLHLFSTNNDARDYNNMCFRKCTNTKQLVYSVDVVVEAITETIQVEVKKELAKQEDHGGTTRCLQLGIGLTYEVDQNINVLDGLFNGTSGTLQFIQYMDMYDKPVALWFQFEDNDIGNVQRHIYRHYRTPEILDTWTPIFATTREFKLKTPKVTIKRKQFPIHQATGKTVHKAQGCTVPEVVISLSSFTFRNGFYVACSRAPKLSNLHIVNFCPSQILTDSKVSGEMKRLREEKPLILQPEIFPNSNAWFSIYYCNIQSLPLHFEYLKRDLVANAANIIVLNETHLVNQDMNIDYEIFGFSLIRFDGQVNPQNGSRPYNGLMVYIQKHFQVTVFSKTRTPRYEYIIIHINDNWKELDLALMYVKPQTSKMEIEMMFQGIMFHLHTVKDFVIVGDFNLNYIHPENRNFMNTLCTTFDIALNITNFTTKQQTIIDYCITRTPQCTQTHYVPWSYHNALTVQIQ